MDPVHMEPHGRRVVPWRQAFRGGSIEDRKLREVEVWMPPMIADLDPAVPSSLGVTVDAALREVAALDEAHGDHLAALATLLLRAEAVASSKIEQVEASVDDYARALHGARANSSAISMAASTGALDDLIRTVDGGGPVDLPSIHRAHAVLMRDDPAESAYAGRTRDMQNWIGGSDHSPRGALYVPPPPDSLSSYLDDLVRFSNREDINVLVQAAIAHAQFESIHPYTDGNGRIGRALINTILRRRGATRRVVVPLASAIVADRDAYFGQLGAYRAGDVGPLIEAFATGARTAAEESRTSAQRLAALPGEWQERAGRPRAGSAAARLLETLIDEPIFTADDASDRVGGAVSSVYAAIERLEASGVARPLTSRKRNQIWVAADVADELEDLGVRIAVRATRTTSD